MNNSNSKKSFRGDIEGMRALAVLLVLIAHVGFGLSSGFIGVDIFFVISGYLITQQLFTLLTKERPLLNFYKRRILRILPAALSVIILTLIASFFLLSPLRFDDYLKDGLASALSYINYRLAYNFVDYFASGSSPFQHYWSLAVEEQFYLFWPLCVILVSKITINPDKFKRNLLFFVLTVFFVSLYASYTLTNIEPSFAYFSMHTRAWQLASGCFLAIITSANIRFQRHFLILFAWLGIIFLMLALIFITPKVPYPGLFALLPTFSAFFLILAGTQGKTSVVSKLLSHPVPQYIGKISYSLYLVHWPILMVYLYIFIDLNFFHKISIILLSFVSATLLYHFIENPIRLNPNLINNAAKTFKLGAASLLLTTTTITVLILSYYAYDNYIYSFSENQPIQSMVQLKESIANGIKPKSLSKIAYNSIYQETRFEDLFLKDKAFADKGLCIALLDEADINSSNSCVFDNGSSKKTIALIGDSHAFQWIGALADYALQNDFKLITFLKVGCALPDQKVLRFKSSIEYQECYTWRDKVLKELETIKPDIIIYHSSFYDTSSLDSFKAYIDKLLSITPRLIKIVDNPSPNKDATECLIRNPDDISICQFNYKMPEPEKQEIQFLKEKNVQIIETKNWFCQDDICPIIIDDQLVYRDQSHISWGYVKYIAKLFTNDLKLK